MEVGNVVVLPQLNISNRINISMSDHVNRIRIARLNNHFQKTAQEAKTRKCKKNETVKTSSFKKDLNKKSLDPSVSSKDQNRKKESEKFLNTKRLCSRPSSKKVLLGTSKNSFNQPSEFLNFYSTRPKSRSDVRPTFRKLESKSKNVQDLKDSSNVKSSYGKISFVSSTDCFNLHKDCNRDSRSLQQNTSDLKSIKKLKSANSKDSANGKISFGSSTARIKLPTDFFNPDSKRQRNMSDVKIFEKLENSASVKKRLPYKISFGSTVDRFNLLSSFVKSDSRGRQNTSDAKNYEKPKDSAHVNERLSDKKPFDSSIDRLNLPADFVNRDFRRQNNISDAGISEKLKIQNKNSKNLSNVKKEQSKGKNVTRQNNALKKSKNFKFNNEVNINKRKNASNAIKSGTRKASNNLEGKIRVLTCQLPQFNPGQEIETTGSQSKITTEGIKNLLNKNRKMYLENKNAKQGDVDSANNSKETIKPLVKDSKNTIVENWDENATKNRSSKVKSNEDSQKYTMQLLQLVPGVLPQAKEKSNKKDIQRALNIKSHKMFLKKKPQSMDALLKKRQTESKAKSSNGSVKGLVSGTALENSNILIQTKPNVSGSKLDADYVPDKIRSSKFLDVEMNISEQRQQPLFLNIKNLSSEDVAKANLLDDSQPLRSNSTKPSSTSVTESLTDTEKEETVMKSHSALELEDVASTIDQTYIVHQ